LVSTGILQKHVSFDQFWQKLQSLIEV